MSHEFPSSIVSMEPFTFCGRGEVWSYAIVHREDAPEQFKDYTPFFISIVQLEEGPRVTAQLTDLDWHEEPGIIDGEKRQVKKFHVEIGMPVEMVTRKLFVEGNPDTGLIIYGPKFRPVLEKQAA